MQELEYTRRPAFGATDRSLGFSRTWRVHLLDIEILIDRGRVGEALRVAAQLPHLCAALADSALHSSFEQYQAWCEQWFAGGVTCYELLTLIERNGISIGLPADGTPKQALKELQRKRLVRDPGVRAAPAFQLEDLTDSRASEVALFVRDAAWRWYTESGAFDPLVQRNLARLAIMRNLI